MAIQIAPTDISEKHKKRLHLPGNQIYILKQNNESYYYSADDEVEHTGVLIYCG